MRIAIGQIEVGDDPAVNLDRVRQVLGQAAGAADLVVFPEATQLRFGNRLADAAQPLDGAFVTGLREAAAAHRVGLIAGCFESAEDGRVYNTAVAIDADGGLAGAYRKIHLFDAFTHRESDTVAPGAAPCVVTVAGGKVGLAICYDLRFPELFRALVDAGAELFVLIAAWAPGSMKEEHWTTLLRARAIENTMWTVGAAKAWEANDPPNGGRTGIGRSLVIDPMGVVRADLGPDPAVGFSYVDLSVTEQTRRTLPSLAHRRLG